ncbi:MAG: hypothetical protein AAGC96_01220 [Pseudomonadota bacterium]
MRYFLHILLVILICCGSAQAQDQAILTSELNEEETLVGQPLILSITILVPTWMSGETNFPNLEVPGIMVRLPQRAGGPISETIDGETWSGVRRRYRLYPLQAGAFTIPKQDISIAYADPDTQAPIDAKLEFEGVSFRAVVPEKAGGIDPLIIARDFSLNQTFEGETELAPGDAITRVLKAEISGTTPVIIPQLSPDFENSLMRAYEAEPNVQESENRGELSGSRTEKTTFIAQGPGSIAIPGFSIEWFDLDTEEIKTVTVPDQSITIAGVALGEDNRIDAGFLVRLAIGLILALLVLLGLYRYAWPPFRRWNEARRAHWHASEAFANRQVLKAIHHQDLGLVSERIDEWLKHVPPQHRDVRNELSAALARMGRSRFGDAGSQGKGMDWGKFKDTYLAQRAQAQRGQRRSSSALPGLNPDWRS